VWTLYVEEAHYRNSGTCVTRNLFLSCILSYSNPIATYDLCTRVRSDVPTLFLCLMTDITPDASIDNIVKKPAFIMILVFSPKEICYLTTLSGYFHHKNHLNSATLGPSRSISVEDSWGSNFLPSFLSLLLLSITM